MGLGKQSERPEDEANLLDYWRVAAKRKWLIVGLTLGSMFSAGFYCYFIATKIYESRAAILAPKETAAGAGLAAALGGAGQFLGVLPGSASNRDAFVAILKSDTMAAELVDRFRLKEHYVVRFDQDAMKVLRAVSRISVSKEGAIVVQVEDPDPKMAADIANAYVAQLDRLFAKMGTAEGGQQRAFIADRIEKTEKGLREAEEALRRFQEQHKAVVLPEQSKGAIEAAAKVRGEIAAAGVQLEAMRAYATETNPNVVQQTKLIEELKRQLAMMQYGQLDLPPEGGKTGKGRREFHVPFDRVPELGMELIRLTREVKVQEAVFTLLTQQYEQAKIQEAKDTPTVQVLDRAVPAQRKAKPRTVLTMAVAGGLALFIALVVSFFLEYLSEVRAQIPASVPQASRSRTPSIPTLEHGEQ
jgi:uncharacterized protein involved in exopolysaccharide biosynthesis